MFLAEVQVQLLCCRHVKVDISDPEKGGRERHEWPCKRTPEDLKWLCIWVWGDTSLSGNSTFQKLWIFIDCQWNLFGLVTGDCSVAWWEARILYVHINGMGSQSLPSYSVLVPSKTGITSSAARRSMAQTLRLFDTTSHHVLGEWVEQCFSNFSGVCGQGVRKINP